MPLLKTTKTSLIWQQNQPTLSSNIVEVIWKSLPKKQYVFKKFPENREKPTDAKNKTSVTINNTPDNNKQPSSLHLDFGWPVTYRVCCHLHRDCCSVSSSFCSSDSQFSAGAPPNSASTLPSRSGQSSGAAGCPRGPGLGWGAPIRPDSGDSRGRWNAKLLLPPRHSRPVVVVVVVAIAKPNRANSWLVTESTGLPCCYFCPTSQHDCASVHWRAPSTHRPPNAVSSPIDPFWRAVNFAAAAPPPQWPYLLLLTFPGQFRCRSPDHRSVVGSSWFLHQSPPFRLPIPK